MELNLRFEDRPIRNVSARQLSRRTSSLLDEILDDGAAVLISRHGRPIALLAPLDEACATREAVRRTAQAEESQLLPQLDAIQRRVLEMVVSEFPYHWDANDPSITWEERSSILSAMTRLDLAGCIEQGDLGVRATQLGRRVAATNQGETSAS